MSSSFIFPGQASQYVGMGEFWFKSYNSVQKTLLHINNIIDYKLTNIMFNGPEVELNKTLHAQPAIVALSVSLIDMIYNNIAFEQVKEDVKFVLGHSLGEYSALYAAKVLSLEDIITILKTRASAMQVAADENPGAMMACIGIDVNKLKLLITENINDGVCQIANDNIEGQIIISGTHNNIIKMQNILKNQSIKAIKLNVSGAFHSDLMQSAMIQVKKVIEQITFYDAQIPVITNYDAKPHTDSNEIKENLIQQICNPVLWRSSLDLLQMHNVHTIYEIGPGTVLSKMIKKSQYNFNMNVIDELIPKIDNIV